MGKFFKDNALLLIVIAAIVAPQIAYLVDRNKKEAEEEEPPKYYKLIQEGFHPFVVKNVRFSPYGTQGFYTDTVNGEKVRFGGNYRVVEVESW